MPDSLETLLEATERLQGAGYEGNWAAADGQIQCGTCEARFDPATVTVDEIVRFEGMSDPGDESILFALTADCDHRGLYSVAYGPNAEPDDIAVVQALPSQPTNNHQT